MSFLSSTEKYHHETLLPAAVTLDRIVAFQKQHDALIKLDPDYRSHEEVTSAAKANSKTYKLIDTNTASMGGETIQLEVTITERGEDQEWVVKAPLGLTQTSLWTVKEGGETKPGEGSGRIWLIENTTIKGNRLVVGNMKSKHEESWKGIHEKWVQHLQGATLLTA